MTTNDTFGILDIVINIFPSVVWIGLFQRANFLCKIGREGALSEADKLKGFRKTYLSFIRRLKTTVLASILMLSRKWV